MKTQQCPSCKNHVPIYLQSQHRIRCLSKLSQSLQLGQLLHLPTFKRSRDQSEKGSGWRCPDCGKQVLQQVKEVHRIVCVRKVETQQSKNVRMQKQMIRMDLLLQDSLPISHDYFDEFPGFQGDCPICLSQMQDKPCIYLDCSHQFHATCIRKWLAGSGRCPVCRKRTDQ